MPVFTRAHHLTPVALLVVFGSAGCLGLIGNSSVDPGGKGGPAPLLATELPPPQFRRLTRVEYNNTVRDLLGDTTNPANEFSEDERVGGFESNSVSGLSQLQFDQYASAAKEMAEHVVSERMSDVVGCEPTDETCVGNFIGTFGLRAFRRPLTDDEKAALLALYQDGKTTWSASMGVQLVIEAMLISPQFFFLTELGEAPEADAKLTALTSYEVAQRLSYFLWQSMPDDALLAAAEEGALSNIEGIEAQARRMLDDQKAGQGVRSFHRQWLGLSGLSDLSKNAEAFPEWNVALADDMMEETMRFSEHVVLEGEGSLDALLSAPYSFVNGALAPVYGLDVTGDFQRVDFDPAQRGGILTQASWLTRTSATAEPSVVFRGKFVREKLFCQHMPDPPPDVDPDATSEERLANPVCAGCHTLMDPIGAGFGKYDAIGQFDALAQNPGFTVNAGPDDVPGSLSDVPALADALSASQGVKDCMTKQWYRYALRREEAKGDEALVQDLQATFTDSEGLIKDLIVAIAKSDAFRFVGIATN
ncbi:MAG: DUF1592 domain-containing protein [Myxococcales bacterium]|nr:DUF1592 domain-containing protein [Myxococcales bacterium]MCB9708053.1 DUF1592 domain-containing protein [Myxococcales bacterium]